jgi:hypothetical protein
MSQLHLIRFRDMMAGKIIETRLKPAFEFWKQDTNALKAAADEQQRNSAIESVISILKNTKREKRSPIDIEVLSKFLVSVACLPKLSSKEMEKLANELDWIACSGRSLIFLQGDFGEKFYMIAQGAVDLFLENSKDKEMINCRQYGDLRGKSMMQEDCQQLGHYLTTLTEGKGFGEYAILSKTHKFRGASAVASADRSLLLVVHASTYK